MTESNVPAVRTTAEVTTTDTDSWVDVAAPVFRLAAQISDTEFVPRAFRGNAPATAAAMLYGREVGLPPLTALQGVHVIEGRPSLSAEMLRSLVYAAGHDIEFTESTGAICTIRGRRRGQERWTSVSWTTDMARAAGLLNKSNWSKDPRAMLVARATTALCRMVFPDVIHGFTSVEETWDDRDGDDTGEAPAGPTTRVGRTAKRPAAKKAAALPSAERPAAVAGPPLPGEDGYDGTSTPQTAGAPAEVPLPETSVRAPSAADEEGADEPGDGEREAPEPGSEVPPTPRPASRAQVRMLMARLQAEFGVKEDQDRYDIASTLTGRTVESYNDLTATEATRMIETLARVDTREELDALLAERSKS